MLRIARILAGALIVFGTALLIAQTPVPLPVTGNLSSIIGNGQPYAGVSIQLQNCASPVSITGYSVIVQQQYQVQANPSGVINTSVWPNNIIDCNGTTGNSQYMLSYVAAGAVQGTPQCYQVVSTQGSWNLNTQQPIVCSQSPPNPQNAQYNNVNITNCLSIGGSGCITSFLSSDCTSTTVDALGNLNCTGTITGGSLAGKTTGIASPTYDVTQYGAVGNGVADDTAAIQAAFNACYNNGASPYGGNVLLQGARSYGISATINMYDSCNPVGVVGNYGSPSPFGSQQKPAIIWLPTATYSNAAFTAFTVATNSTYYPVSSPNNLPPKTIAVTAANTLAFGNWVEITGCTGSGVEVNNIVGQVVAASGAAFTITYPDLDMANGSFTDSTCQWKQTQVMMATDATARYGQLFSNFQLYAATAGIVGAELYMGDRIDSGTRFSNFQPDGRADFGLYLPFNGINWTINDGSRSDVIPAIAAIYVRQSGGGGAWSINDAEISNGYTIAGSSIMIDGQSCEGGITKAALNDVAFEVDTSMFPNSAPIDLLACPTEAYPQFSITMQGGGVTCGSNAGYMNCPSVLVSPQSSGYGALVLHTANAGFPTGSGATPYQAFVGVPSLLRGNMTGTTGNTGALDFSPPLWSEGNTGTGTIGQYSAVNQSLNDYNFNQLWQQGIHASALLKTDTAFAALANATTLYAGQVVAPPANWSAVISNQRYGLQVVYQTGTTGTPNSGLTNCVASGVSGQLQCVGSQATITATSCSTNALTVTASNSFTANQQIFLTGTAERVLNGANYTVASATGSNFVINYQCNGFTGNASDTGTAVTSSTVDLESGQHVSIGSVTNAVIESINASNPNAVLLNMSTSVAGVTSPTNLTFSAPLLGPEMQLPTKRPGAAPTSQTWLQGDEAQNSSATANGIAAYVNVAAGTPGTWAAIPLGDSSGHINTGQINGYTAPTVTAGSPTVGQAACIKAAGPPVVIGYCSTVVSALGACTCN
jgi:hypothetical protein